MKTFLRASIPVAFVALAAASCSAVDRQTQVTVALSSETEIPKELDSFAIRVTSTRTGELRFSKDYYPSSGREFPTTLAVIPFDEDALKSPLQIEIEGRQNGVTFLDRKSIISYVKDRNILLTLPLRMACFKFRTCGPNETCAGGECVPAEVDAAKLPDFDERAVFGVKNPDCFDEDKCLSEPVEVAVGEDCTFTLPPNAPADRGNVSIRWQAAPERLLALEAGDLQEGWQRTSATTGKLSKGACDSHLRRLGPDQKPLVPDVAEKVYFSPGCSAKTPQRPYCLSKTTGHAGIGAVIPQ
jgi:hypothetical protein